MAPFDGTDFPRCDQPPAPPKAKAIPPVFVMDVASAIEASILPKLQPYQEAAMEKINSELLKKLKKVSVQNDLNLDELTSGIDWAKPSKLEYGVSIAQYMVRAPEQITLFAADVARKALDAYHQGMLSAQHSSAAGALYDKEGYPCAVGASLTRHQAEFLGNGSIKTGVEVGVVTTDDLDSLMMMEHAHDSWVAIRQGIKVPYPIGSIQHTQHMRDAEDRFVMTCERVIQKHTQHVEFQLNVV